MATKKVSKYSVKLEDLLESGAHFGHQVRRWNPRMGEYIWAARGGVHIFDLPKTAEKLVEACEFLRQSAADGKSIVMVGTKRQAADIVREEAIKSGVFHVTVRWLGGAITNWKEIRKRIDRLVDMKEKREAGEYKKYTKKEQVDIGKEIAKLERFFGGLEGLEREPDVMFVVDTHKERTAVREAVAKGVTVVGMVDSNADPALVDYVIPVNDDSARSIKLVVEKVGAAILEGKKELQKKAKKQAAADKKSEKK